MLLLDTDPKHCSFISPAGSEVHRVQLPVTFLLLVHYFPHFSFIMRIRLDTCSLIVTQKQSSLWISRLPNQSTLTCYKQNNSCLLHTLPRCYSSPKLDYFWRQSPVVRYMCRRAMPHNVWSWFCRHWTEIICENGSRFNHPWITNTWMTENLHRLFFSSLSLATSCSNVWKPSWRRHTMVDCVQGATSLSFVLREACQQCSVST